MPTIGFVLVCGILIYISYYISHDMINIVSVFTVPYMLIVPINNFIMINRGFYMISEQVLCLIGGSLLCIFIGYIATSAYLKVHKKANIYQEQELESKFFYYNMQRMLRYVLVVEAVELLRLIYIIGTHSISYLASARFEGYMLSGPLGHLLLTAYPLAPILLLYWLSHKRKIAYLISALICVGLLFATFIKYHVIGMIVLMYLFISLEDRKYLRKGLIIVSGTAIGAFVLNYILLFTISGAASRGTQDYYINHFWNYMAGSVIHDNRVFTDGINIGLSLLWKIARLIFTPINSLCISLFGIGMTTPNVGNPIGYVSISSTGEWGNVIDAFGHFYPSKGSLIEIIMYFVFLVFIGFLFTLLYNNSTRKKDKFHTAISVFLDFFCFFSFFGQFYYNLPCWEVLIYSIIVPKLFDKRVKIVLHR